MKSMPYPRTRGFSLLEAVVALTIVATLGMALMTWVNTSLITFGRIQDQESIAEAKLNIIEFMRIVNPMLRPEGKQNMGFYQISWEAKKTTPVVDGVNYPGGQGYYQFALYDTQIRVQKKEERDRLVDWFDFTLRQVGYKKVREFKLPF